MHKNKYTSSITITIFVIFIGAVIFIISPITYTGKAEVDYSPRYYELLKKNPLTEQERAEFYSEMCKGTLKMIEHFEKKKINSVVEQLYNNYETNCHKL